MGSLKEKIGDDIFTRSKKKKSVIKKDSCGEKNNMAQEFIVCTIFIFLREIKLLCDV